VNNIQDLFITIINMSITASFVAVGVMLIRPLLRKAPKILSYALWTAVLFRLFCPVTFTSTFSFLRLLNLNVQQSRGVMNYVPPDIGLMPNPAIHSGVNSIDSAINASLPQAIPIASVNPLQIWLAGLSIIWLAGIIFLLGYSLISYLKIKRLLQTATLVRDNIFETDQIATALVCGFIRPKIYVPVGVSESVNETHLFYILAHEQTHIRRCDYLIKPLAFLVLAVHWFNPLIWLSFYLMSRDMEMSCDESVLRKLGSDIKGDYANSLLALSVKRNRLLTANPLAFGESNVKARIKNAAHYKKPALWVLVAAVVICCALVAGLVSNPQVPFDVEKTRAEAMLFSTGETDLLKIGEAAFDRYYSSFMGENIPREYRITGYKLTNIFLFAGNEKEFCVLTTADYSTTTLYFLSANGAFYPTDKGYNCEGSTLQFRIKNLGNNHYQTVSIGTGGGEQGLLPVQPDNQKQFIEDRINIIMSSPGASSNPGDYISAHQTEYNEIIALDAQALPYFFSVLEKGENGLKAYIMVILCREILGGEDIKYQAASAQDWYDYFKAHVQNLADRNSPEWVKENYPKSGVLLTVIDSLQ